MGRDVLELIFTGCCWFLLSSVRLGTRRGERSLLLWAWRVHWPSQMSYKRKSVYWTSLKFRILGKFLIGHRGFWMPNNSSSTTHTFASTWLHPFSSLPASSLPHPTFWFSLCLPFVCFFFFLTNENCIRTMLREKLNGIHLGIHSQISTACIQLLSYLDFAWRNRDIITLIWMDASSYRLTKYHSLSCWGFRYGMRMSWNSEKISERLTA